jgi:steroid delta-isomerase
MTTTVSLAPEAIQAVVNRYFAATRSLDLDAWLSTFASDATCYEPGNPPLQGHAALSQFFIQFASLFRQVGLQEDFVAIDGNQAAVKWTGRGTGLNGREVVFEGIDLFELNENGTIQKARGYWDPAAVIAELQSK